MSAGPAAAPAVRALLRDMLPDLPPPTLVQDAAGLARVLDDLARQSVIAVDTEADSFFNYREKVCLVQLTVEDRDYLVDPLAGFDLAPLGRILEDPRKEKIFHDGEYDVLILKRNYGFRFASLFDTRVAAAALGDPNPGLASVLKGRFGVELDKSMQRSNWSARPLSEKQISYARLDTHYLIPLAGEQKPDLGRLGRARIVEGECRRLEQLVPADVAFHADEYIRLNGARQLGPAEQQALRELYTLRNRLAQEADLPPFKVLNNQALIDVARAQPHSLRELTHVPGFSQRQTRKVGEEVLAALARARELGPLRRPPSLPPKDGTGHLSEEEFDLHERLKAWRRDCAAREGYDASLVLNRHVLVRLALRKPKSRAELGEVDGLLDWQIESFGDELLAAIENGRREFQANGPQQGRRRGFGRSAG